MSTATTALSTAAANPSVTSLLKRRATPATLPHRHSSLAIPRRLGIAGIDVASRLLFADPAFLRLTGLPPEAVLGRRLFDVFQLEGSSTADFVPEIPPPQSVGLELRHRNGGAVSSSLTATLVPCFRGTLRGIVVLDDGSERMTIEDHLRRFQRLENLDHLLSGVAHDLNNLVTVILGHLELMLFGGSPDDGEALRASYEATRQTASLCRYLLAFGGSRSQAETIGDLNEAIAASERPLRRFLPDSIELVLDLADGSHPVPCTSAELNQIVLNLVKNAAEALTEGGRIVVSTFSKTVTDGELCGHSVTNGEYEILQVLDTGEGIEPSTHQRMFDPFFSTKGASGLGLTMVHDIVRRVGGHICVETQQDLGSRMSVCLPTRRSSRIGTRHSVSGLRDLRGQETLLLVEDEDNLRQLMISMLEHLGYTVIAAEGPEQALRLAGDPGIDLALVDAMLPGAVPGEVAQSIRRSRPELPLLVMSGYPADVLERQGFPTEPFRFLGKPFSGKTLAHAVREILDEKPKETSPPMSGTVSG